MPNALWGGSMNELNYEEMCQSTLKDIEDLERLIFQMKNEIKRLKSEENDIKHEVTPSCSIMEKREEEVILEDSFEEAIDFYLLNYRLLREGFTDNEIRSLLPRKNHPDYVNILLRLSLESTKEINEIKELLKEDISDDDRILCENLIIHEQRKIEYIKNRLFVSEDVSLEEEEEKNNIVLVPTLGGNIRIIDDLEHIPSDYYDGFKELIDSIVDGTFKNVKLLKNDNFMHIFEVKAFKIRVVFARINENTFALITAFIKKSDTDKLYRESLFSKIRDYYLVEDRLKSNLSSQEFQEANSSYVNYMWNILSPSDIKTLRKENK